jgi:hypothetical protein
LSAMCHDGLMHRNIAIVTIYSHAAVLVAEACYRVEMENMAPEGVGMGVNN